MSEWAVVSHTERACTAARKGCLSHPVITLHQTIRLPVALRCEGPESRVTQGGPTVLDLQATQSITFELQATRPIELELQAN